MLFRDPRPRKKYRGTATYDYASQDPDELLSDARLLSCVAVTSDRLGEFPARGLPARQPPCYIFSLMAKKSTVRWDRNARGGPLFLAVGCVVLATC